ncbi:MAG TPA: hypothetical protein VD794_03055 [Flavisolibacter sp.]|nr:hypothetical protein [Flavisolibacter sp.]
MARTINEIFTDKMQRVAADPTLGPALTSTSRVAIYRLMLYISAVCDWTLETFQDLFKKEVNETIANMKPHSPLWYANKAKAFQYGFDLVPEADYYDNTGLRDDEIEASRIVRHAAVVELPRGLRIKVATHNGTDLQKLTADQLTSLKAYFARVKDAGVNPLVVTTDDADALKLSLRIKYNPLVLNAMGGRIDGTTATPIQEAIKNFLENLPFNGVFSVQALVDAIQAVEGVEDLSIDLVQTKYGALPFSAVNIQYIPDSGYLRIADEDLFIQMLAA